MAYLDNIIIYRSTPEEHLEHIRTVFEKLRDAKLSMKLSKCHFVAKEIQYLGHILGKEGIKPVPAKIETIKVMHPPVNLKQVRAFLRLVGYYRKFITNFAKNSKATIMKRLLNKTAPKHELKTFFIHNGLLYRYASDHSKDFCALVIPKAWKYTILVETHDKMGHQGNNRTYSLIKRQYYWKGLEGNGKRCERLHPTMSRMSSREGTSPVISTTHDGNTRQTLRQDRNGLSNGFHGIQQGK